MRTQSRPGTRTHLHTRPAGLDSFKFEASADLILAFSAIEHLRDLKAVRRLLDQVRGATRPGGVVAIGIVADRVEVGDNGRRRPALLESAMSAAEATALLTGFDVTYQRLRPAQVRENRGEDTHTLTSTLVTWLATQSAGPLSDVRFLTVYEVARLMRLSKMSVYRLLHSGELEAVRVGRSLRVPEQAVVSYLRDAAFAPAGRQIGEAAMRDTWT